MTSGRAHACSPHEHAHASASRKAWPSPPPLSQSPGPSAGQRVKTAGCGKPNARPRATTPESRAPLLPQLSIKRGPAVCGPGRRSPCPLRAETTLTAATLATARATGPQERRGAAAAAEAQAPAVFADVLQSRGRHSLCKRGCDVRGRGRRQPRGPTGQRGPGGRGMASRWGRGSEETWRFYWRPLSSDGLLIQSAFSDVLGGPMGTARCLKGGEAEAGVQPPSRT